MEQMKTPVSKKNPAFNRLLKNTIEIPGSPAMPCIGIGTGDFEVAKLCDFGVILHVNTKGVALPDQYYVGTESWSAPEVLENDGVGVTTKADIFSYGLILWEMLAVKPPHTPEEIPEDPSGNDGSIFDESFFGAFGTRPELPSGLSSVYDDVIHVFNWCCEAEPDARPSAIQIQDYLQASKMQ